MLRSPQVLRHDGLAYVIHFNEGNEPPHVHVYRGKPTSRSGKKAKVWLAPVGLCVSEGFSASELRYILQLVRERLDFFMEEWHATQAKKR